MFPSPSFTNIHSFVANEFNRLRMQAFRASLLAKFFGKNSGLKNLSENLTVNLQNKRYTGIHNISTDRIIGTVGRNDDFDKEFRPRRNHLRDRWVNTFIRLDEDGWAPIIVHKVGDAYFVEDGHHRVSVARSVGMIFMEAEVWEHPCRAVQSVICRSPRRLVKKPVKACTTD